MLVASYYFYMSWNPVFGLLLASTTLIDFYTALKMSRTDDLKAKKRWLYLSLITNIGCLFVFKYFVFFHNSSAYLIGAITGGNYNILENIVVPVGLSFYTFQSLSYTIDVYRGAKAESNPARFALFVSFFPQLVAGPIERFSHLGPQFYEKHKITLQNLTSGIKIATWGFFKKMVIADSLATLVNPVFADVHSFSGLTLLIIGFFFVIQVYCDFSGYSDIAIGVARFFGFELMLNWRRPLLSRSLIEFWKRNHISMTTWFRDYLYISLGGSRCSNRRWLLNIFLVFLISGLWHGANWTFVVWGSMHGLAYVIELILNKKGIHPFKNYPLVGWGYLLTFHTLSLIAFRANSISDLFSIYSKIFSFNFNVHLSWIELMSVSDAFPLLIAVFLIIFLFLKELHEEYNFGFEIVKRADFIKPVFYVLIFVMIFVLGQFNSNEFIYFHF